MFLLIHEAHPIPDFVTKEKVNVLKVSKSEATVLESPIKFFIYWKYMSEFVC